MVLRTSEFLVKFLQESDQQEFMLRAVAASQEEGPRNINDITTLGGEIDVKANKQAKQFCDNFSNFINTYGEINTFIA